MLQKSTSHGGRNGTEKNEETDEKLVDLDSMFDSPKADTVSKDYRKYSDESEADGTARSSNSAGYKKRKKWYR